MAKRTKAVDTVTEIILIMFRLNAGLLEQGDRLVAPLGLTSARWQVLGAIATAGEPQTAPQIASAMGITRQGVQKQLNLAITEGQIESHRNPRHERSPLHSLSKKGRRAYEQAMALQVVWAQSMTQSLSLSRLQGALEVLSALENHLESKPISRSASQN
ncbi:MAG: MarR family winged helix-turn-helix transcriptional regulator [Usitatibacter sp.]